MIQQVTEYIYICHSSLKNLFITININIAVSGTYRILLVKYSISESFFENS